MGGWSTSYRWAGVTRDKLSGMVAHDGRDVDHANGVEVGHSNPQIDAGRIEWNRTTVNDGTGRQVPCRDSSRILAAVDRRLAQVRNTRTLKDGLVVPVAIRKDAAVVMEFVLMLDPEFTGDCASMTPEKRSEVERLLQVQVDEVTDLMGAHNVTSVHWHLDETHPHVQMFAVPLDADGRLGMRSFVGGDTKAASQQRYRELHDSMRRRLQAAGYAATMERVDGGKKHLGLAEYKRQRDQDADRESRMTEGEADLERGEAELSRRTVQVHAGLRTREWEISQAESEIADGRAEVDRLRDHYKEAIAATQQEKAAAATARSGYVAATAALDSSWRNYDVETFRAIGQVNHMTPESLNQLRDAVVRRRSTNRTTLAAAKAVALDAEPAQTTETANPGWQPT